MGIYACPRCKNPFGWWSGNMQDIHDCPGYPPKRKAMNILANGDGNSLIGAEPNPVPTVPEYTPDDAIEVLRKWFAERGAEFNPEEFPAMKPDNPQPE